MNGPSDRNPGVRCARRKPPCGHTRAEHADGRCFGVVMVAGVPADCGCAKGFLEPEDRAPQGRAPSSD